MEAHKGRHKRLRPWLEKMINSGEIRGLEWVNEQKTMFKIPWKHHSKQKQEGCSEESRIFMEWAKQTGRYREGIDQPDYPTWKTRLRCAFNKATDISEVKEMSQLCDVQPYRVYRLTPDTSKSTHATCYSTRQNYQYQTCEQSMQTSSSSQYLTVQCRRPTVYSEGEFTTNLSTSACGKREQSDFEDQLIVEVAYCGRVAKQLSIRQQSGCRLYYGTQALHETLVTLPSALQELLFGPQQVEAVHFPPCNEFMQSDTQVQACRALMDKGLQRGVILRGEGNDISAFRLCQAAVFYSSKSMTGGAARKLPRDLHTTSVDPYSFPVSAGQLHSTKIFDYDGQFIPALNDFLDGRGPKPDPRCYLVFGQEVALSSFDPSVLIAVCVSTKRALQDVVNAENRMANRCPEVLISEPSDFDQLSKEVKDVKLEHISEHRPQSASYEQQQQQQQQLSSQMKLEQRQAVDIDCERQMSWCDENK